MYTINDINWENLQKYGLKKEDISPENMEKLLSGQETDIIQLNVYILGQNVCILGSLRIEKEEDDSLTINISL